MLCYIIICTIIYNYTYNIRKNRHSLHTVIYSLLFPLQLDCRYQIQFYSMCSCIPQLISLIEGWHTVSPHYFVVLRLGA